MSKTVRIAAKVLRLAGLFWLALARLSGLEGLAIHFHIHRLLFALFGGRWERITPGSQV